MKIKLYPARAGLLLQSTIVNLMTNHPISAASFDDDLAFLQKHTNGDPPETTCTTYVWLYQW
jgi:hypothetical protein